MNRLSMAAVALACTLAACRTPSAESPPVAEAPQPGPVRDLAAFERFVATQPTPAQLRARYPDLKLVLPGEIATKELRMDNSRYFAQLDAQGRIVGGRFQ